MAGQSEELFIICAIKTIAARRRGTLSTVMLTGEAQGRREEQNKKFHEKEMEKAQKSNT
jgi:hypothetical protein